MNSLFEKYKWLKYVIGSFIIALGVLVIILASVGSGAVKTAITIVMAIAAMVVGLVFLLLALLSESHKGFTMTLLFGAIGLAAGIILLVQYFGLGDSFNDQLLVYTISIFALVFGAITLAKAVSLIVFKEKAALIVLLFIVAIACIVAGILGIVFVGDLIQAAYIILGVGILVVGILFLVFSAIKTKK